MVDTTVGLPFRPLTKPVTKKPLNPGRTRTVLPALPVNLCEFVLLPHVRTRTEVRVILRVTKSIKSGKSTKSTLCYLDNEDDRRAADEHEACTQKKTPLNRHLNCVSSTAHSLQLPPAYDEHDYRRLCENNKAPCISASVPPRQVSVDEFPTKSPHRALRPSSSDTTPNNQT